FGQRDRPVTSELTGEELWNLARMGYGPLRLLLGTSVYSLGFAQGIGAFFKGLSRGEVDSITRLIYEARTNCLPTSRPRPRTSAPMPSSASKCSSTKSAPASWK